jgi:hypothetical protein
MSYYKQKRLIISEQERNEILSKYGIINEVNIKVDDFTLKVGSRGFFANGKWKNLKPEAQAEFEKDKEATKNFVKEWGNIPGYIIEVKIEASESRVTNYDREVEGNVRLKEGELSKRRADTMKRILTGLFESYLKEGIIKEMPVFKESIIKIGETPYVRGTSNPKDPVYDKERYVFYSLKAVREKTPPLIPPTDCKIIIQFVSNSETLKKNKLVFKAPDADYKSTPDVCKAGWGFCAGCSGRVGNTNAKFKVLINGDTIGRIDMSGSEGSLIKGVKIPSELTKKLKDNTPLNLSIEKEGGNGTFNFGFRIFKFNEQNKPILTYESCLPVESYILTNEKNWVGIDDFELALEQGNTIKLGTIKDCNGTTELASLQNFGFGEIDQLYRGENPKLLIHKGADVLKHAVGCPKARFPEGF